MASSTSTSRTKRIEPALVHALATARVQALLGLAVDPLAAQPVGLGLLHECSLEGREALLQLGRGHGGTIRLPDRTGRPQPSPPSRAVARQPRELARVRHVGRDRQGARVAVAHQLRR